MALIALLGAVIWLVARSGERPGGALPALPPEERPRSLVELADLPARDPLPESQEPAASLPPPEAPASAAGSDARGSITGIVLDCRGRLLPRHRVACRRAGDTQEGRSFQTLSDKLGQYGIERVPVGTWSILYRGDVRDYEARESEQVMGTVDVLEGRAAVFDVVLRGDRSFSGAVTLAGASKAVLRLELRSELDPEHLVGMGWASPEQEEEKPLTDWQGDDRETGTGREERRRPGAFRFGGLEPGPYLFRVILGKDVHTGEELYVERSVDLMERDVVLDPIAYTQLDFVDATLERRK